MTSSGDFGRENFIAAGTHVKMSPVSPLHSTCHSVDRPLKHDEVPSLEIPDISYLKVGSSALLPFKVPKQLLVTASDRTGRLCYAIANFTILQIPALKSDGCRPQHEHATCADSKQMPIQDRAELTNPSNLAHQQLHATLCYARLSEMAGPTAYYHQCNTHVDTAHS